MFTGAPSGQVEGHFPARRAVGIPFCAGKDAFFCLESPWSTFCAGLRVISCPAGGWYLILRRKRCLFLPGTALKHRLHRIGGVFLPGRWVVSHSAPEKIPFSARSRPGAPSAQDWGRFPARQAGGIPFRAGNDTFFCPELPRGTFCAGFGAFSCPAGGGFNRYKRRQSNGELPPFLLTLKL